MMTFFFLNKVINARRYEDVNEKNIKNILILHETDSQKMLKNNKCYMEVVEQKALISLLRMIT